MRLRTAAVVDPGQRDALVLAHVDLVKAMANRLRRRLPAQVEVQELVGAGVVGLIDAASRFEPALGVPFDAFARRRIHGAMLDALRGLDCVPRSVRRMQRQAEHAIAGLRQSLRREPESEEIAAALGITPDQYLRLLDELRTTEVAVVHGTCGDADAVSALTFAVDPDEGPLATLERHELRRQLAVALTRLPDRERQILSLSYVEELTLAEIGQVFGIGESRVSQLRTQAIIRLRTSLQAALAKAEAR